MPERAAVAQGLQIGVEATPGTLVAANKRLVNLSLTPGVNIEFNRSKPSGAKFASTSVPGKEMTLSKIEGITTYSELVYLLSSCCAYAAPVQQGGTTAYLWTHAMATSDEDAVKTLTFEQGSTARAHKAGYGVVTGLDFEFTREACTFGGSMMHTALSDGATLTGSPTSIENTPIVPKHVSVYSDTTAAGLGGTKLTRVLRAGVKIENRFGPVFTVDATNASYATTVELEPTCQLTLLLEADAAGMTPLSDARSVTSKFFRIEAVSDVLAGTALPYKLRFDMCGQVSSISEFQESDGVYAIEYTFDFTNDPTWGKASTFALTNKLTAL